MPDESNEGLAARYGFEQRGYHRGSPTHSVRCLACGVTLPRDGSVMRSHARKCPVEPRVYDVPGVCDA
jgi:ribosomal protein S26